MKKIFTFLKLIFFLIPFAIQSQTASTISNGNWTNPLTWNCTCVPVNGYSVTINHSVTLNTSMLFNTGGITVNNTGALVQDASLNRDIWINGGYFNNNGKSNFRYFLISSGTGSNAGTFTLSAFTNSVSFTNSGSLKMDSMYIASNFTNTASGSIIGDSLTNASTLINNGNINITWVTNNSLFTNNNFQTGYAFTNDGTYNNYDSLILTGSVWNKKMFYNKPGAKFNMNKNFHNYHPSNTAVFENNGMVKVFDSWYNTDTVKGSSTGYFIVTDTSANSGHMKGNFGFCDLTPPATAPYVDLNSGIIAPGITWCSSVGINENKIAENSFRIYPNPNNGAFTIKGNEAETLFITDELGKVLITIELNKENQFQYQISGLYSGIYFLKGKTKYQKIVITN